MCILWRATSAPAQDTKQPAAVVGVSVTSLENYYFKQVVAGMKLEAAKHNVELQIKESGFDLARQKRQIDDLLIGEVDVIAVSPFDSKGIAPAIKEANQAGVPVFTFDMECSDKTTKVVSHIGLDNHWGGKVAGQAMIKLLGREGGKVGVLSSRKLQATRDRVQGFSSAIEKHNKTASRKITIVEQVDIVPTTQNGYRDGKAMLRAFPNLRGIFAINDPAAMGAALAVKRANKRGNVVVVGFDGSQAGRKAVALGELNGTVEYSAEEVGTKTIQSIVKSLAGKKVPPRSLIKSKFYGLAESQQQDDLVRNSDD